MWIKNLITKIRIKRKEKEYIRYIVDHKNRVMDAFVEVLGCPSLSYLWEDLDFYNDLVDKITCHDDSKFSIAEYDAYRKKFYPIKEEFCTQEEFDKAWKHHLTLNDHHWESRAAANHKILTREDKLAILENVCDWLAMGYNFGDRPCQYYDKVKEEIISGGLPNQDRKFLEFIINVLEEDKEINPNYDYGRKNK